MATATTTKTAPSKKNQSLPDVFASVRFVHISPIKVRLVAAQLVGKSMPVAIDTVRFINKRAAGVLLKLLNTAVANADHNFNFDKTDLFIKKLIVNAGPVMKRQRPVAYGRSTPIRRPSSHIELTVGVKAGAKQKDTVQAKPVKKDEPVKVLSREEIKEQRRLEDGESKAEGREKPQQRRGVLKKMFSRKTGE